MNRKVIQLGTSTLVLSLPKQWTKQNNILAGAELSVVELGPQLSVCSSRPLTRKSQLDLRSHNALLKRILASRYLRGDDEIEVLVEPKHARLLHERVREMIGMEVVSQHKNGFLVKDLSGTTHESFDQLLRRVFFMINTVAEESVLAFVRKEQNLGYLCDMESNINRFCDHCFRLLNKQGHPDYHKTPILYALVLLLEQFADEYKRIIRLVHEHQIKPTLELINIIKKINQLFKTFETLFYSFTYTSAITLARTHDTLQQILQHTRKKTTSPEIIELLFILQEMTSLVVRMMGQLLTVA